MRSWLLALIALLMFAPWAKAAKEPTYDAFCISRADAMRVVKKHGDEQLEVTLCAAKAKEFLDFTRRHVGQTVIIAWMEPNPASAGMTIYSNFLVVKAPIGNGVIRVTNPYARARPGTLIAT
jgi:hypothetical protein